MSQEITADDYEEMLERTVEITFDEVMAEGEPIGSDLFEDDFFEALHQQGDAHGWVGNSQCSLAILEHGSNPEEWKHYVSDGDDYQEVIDAMAYATFQQDLHRVGWEVLEEQRSHDQILREIYENAIERPNGFMWEYAGYTFQKADGPWTSHHSEVALYNEDGNKVESYTLFAYDSFLDFAEDVERLMDYGPEDAQDWLDHCRAERADS
jgi:hypothetical protein